MERREGDQQSQQIEASPILEAAISAVPTPASVPGLVETTTILEETQLQGQDLMIVTDVINPGTAIPAETAVSPITPDTSSSRDKISSEVTSNESAMRAIATGTEILTDSVSSQRMPNGYWNNPEHIRERARGVIAKGIKLDSKSLSKAGESSFLQAIYHYYPGTLFGLRADLGVENPRRQTSSLVKEEIERQASSLLQQGHKLTITNLRRIGRADLERSLRSYPGGIRALRANMQESSPVPSYWKVKESFFGSRKTKSFRSLEKEHPEWHGIFEAESGIVAEYFSPDFIERVKATRGTRHSWDLTSIENEALLCIEQGATLTRYGLRSTNKDALAYAIEKHYPGGYVGLWEKLGVGQDKSRSHKFVVRKFSEFVEEVASGESVTSESFKKLISLFGSSRVVDILWHVRPEFKGRIHPDKVKGIIAKYLGDFLVVKGAFNPGDISEGIKFLSDPNLAEGLLEVIKDNALSNYNKLKKEKIQWTDQEIFANYFLDLKARISSLIDSQAGEQDIATLKKIVTKGEEYYRDLLALEKPARIVERLREGRQFPDINQLINMAEVKEDRRVLIADEMGLGKSASAILSKEALGLRQAIIITPSNVVRTWLKYLSDRPGGYFRDGMSPKVLVVNSPEDLLSPDIQSYEYVILSQERLDNLEYVQALESVGYEMLIVDEIHKLKNINSGARANNLIRLTSEREGEQDTYLVLLSGTPVPNKVQDVAIYLKLLYPERFSRYKNEDLVKKIIEGDVVDIRNLLVPRMQMKSLAETVVMPELKERVIDVELSGTEHDVYEVLMEEDEISASDKIRLFRQFLLYPDLLATTPGIQSSKLTALQERIEDVFQRKNKYLLFVNDYVEGIMRGEGAIFDKLNIPEDVEVFRIMGGISPEERDFIQRELNESKRRMLVIVNGQTADVGVDFSGADVVDFYNEPWTYYDKRQQLARVYREGLTHDVESATFIVKNTIEEGIHRYIEVKHKAIEKLLKGVPISELEKELLTRAEKQPDLGGVEVNSELAEYYFSAWDRMMKIFAYVKELGEDDFTKFLVDYGEEYAETYVALGSRSYQANANRVAGAIVDSISRERGQDLADLKILDMASGPEMLKRHIPDAYRNQIVSLDLNGFHFPEGESETRKVGSFLEIPFPDRSFDLTNLSLAWHYTKFSPKNGKFERLEVLAEANRVLKDGGRLMITNIYMRDIKDESAFRVAIERLGFKVVEKYTGKVTAGENFNASVYTLEKVSHLGRLEDKSRLAEIVGQENINGVKFVKSLSRIKDSRKIITSFVLGGIKHIIRFNNQDLEVLQEESEIQDVANLLKVRFGQIQLIPGEDVISKGFIRIKIGKKYLLFRRLQKGPGVMVVS